MALTIADDDELVVGARGHIVGAVNDGATDGLPNGFREVQTVSIADRFQARLRKSAGRLSEIVAALAEADEAAAVRLLGEAASIAHVLAGTAGLFGQAPLGKVARQVEAEIKGVSKGRLIPSTSRASQTIGKLIGLLHSAAERSASPSSVSLCQSLDGSFPRARPRSVAGKFISGVTARARRLHMFNSFNP